MVLKVDTACSSAGVTVASPEELILVESCYSSPKFYKPLWQRNAGAKTVTSEPVLDPVRLWVRDVVFLEQKKKKKKTTSR